MALYVNGKQISGGGGGGNTNSVELTYAEYQALTPEQQLDGTEYFITDINGDGQQFQPVCYSETEREIGVWKDGRPLYEKCYALQSAIAFTQNAWISTTISASSMSTLVDCVLMYNSSAYTPTFTKIEDNVVQVYNGASVLFRFDTVILRYTKTTDTAGSGTWTPQGVPAHHYSTDEQVVGTWIDGSTLYEKTLYFNNKTATLSNSTCELVHGITNIGTVKFVESAYIDFDGGTDWATAMNTIPTNGVNYNFMWVVGSDAIYLKSGTTGLEFSATVNRSYLFTIKYTKSST